MYGDVHRIEGSLAEEMAFINYLRKKVKEINSECDKQTGAQKPASIRKFTRPSKLSPSHLDCVKGRLGRNSVCDSPPNESVVTASVIKQPPKSRRSTPTEPGLIVSKLKAAMKRSSTPAESQKQSVELQLQRALCFALNKFQVLGTARENDMALA